MNLEEVKTAVFEELPYLIQTDEEIRQFIIHLGRERFADKNESLRHFDLILRELQEQRRQSDRRWEEHQKKSDEFQQEQARKWDENTRKWDENTRKWDEYRKESETFQQEQARKWDEYRKESEAFRQEQARKWDEDTRRWNENQAEIRKLHKKYESTIGALGARWGLNTEQSFRNALKDILEKNFGVEVMSVNMPDHDGTVFGRPDQVEIDVIIRNGMLIICEIKSSIDKAGMYIFERKARFYEEKSNRKASKLIVISPMIDKRAKPVAENLGIITYSGAESVEEL